jgi:hypothetical protein
VISDEFSALRDEPGEQLTTTLDALRPVGVLALHHRRVRRVDANIDHLVVVPGGVWVIHAPRGAGRLSFEVRGRPGPRQALFVQDRVRSLLLSQLQDQVERVRAALLAAGAEEVPVRGALCFVGVPPAAGLSPVEARRLLVTWPERLEPVIRQPGPFDEEDCVAIQRVLARAFPAAAA